jgi:hypothetical protein
MQEHGSEEVKCLLAIACFINLYPHISLYVLVAFLDPLLAEIAITILFEFFNLKPELLGILNGSSLRRGCRVDTLAAHQFQMPILAHH